MIEPEVDLPFNGRTASYPKWRIAIRRSVTYPNLRSLGVVFEIL